MWFMRSLRYLLLAAAAPAVAHADTAISFDKVAAAQVPAALKPKGAVDLAWHWKDKNGDNYLVTSSRDAQGESDRSSYLYVVHGACQGTNCRPLRQVKDLVEQCSEDITLDFDPSTVTVTDLDANGYSEVAFVYRLSCRGDISPNDQKLMLLTNGQKYAVRGSEKAVIDGQKVGGEMRPDPAFKKAPAAFLAHAKALWKKYTPTKKY